MKKQIQQISEILPHNRIEVIFFADFNKAVVTTDKLAPYSEKTKRQYDVESARRRINFSRAMLEIAEAHRGSPEGIASQMLTENISGAENFQEHDVGSASVVHHVDDRFLSYLRSKVIQMKKSMAKNPKIQKKVELINHELTLTTMDLKNAASIDDPDPDHTLEILKRFLSEILPGTTRSQLLDSSELVEVIVLLTDYNGNDEMWEFNEAVKKIVEAKVAEIRVLAEEALEKIMVSKQLMTFKQPSRSYFCFSSGLFPDAAKKQSGCMEIFQFPRSPRQGC